MKYIRYLPNFLAKSAVVIAPMITQMSPTKTDEMITAMALLSTSAGT